MHLTIVLCGFCTIHGNYVKICVVDKMNALQRQENLQLQFVAEITIFNPHQLVFLDETGIVSMLHTNSFD